ncbi:MAG: hypothetical protein LPK45_00650 [Bacteroidota bacterium]|nr:hypothetical protein [Bacteroidota bacterium]MDX5429533.1 hypothetical protein [Bacteroidota bacterium]MDX5468320.1 hypothetical protein [Bacteroidota bacterium]
MKKLFLICSVFIFLLSACELDPAPKTTSTLWFSGYGKYTVPTVKVDGKVIGKISYYISNVSEINCDNPKGLIHRVKPGKYYIEILDDNMRPIKGGNVKVDETGKCYPFIVD